jgi:hypothetical protein
MNTENQLNEQAKPADSQVETTQNLEITKDIGIHLNKAGKWGNFLAILGFIAMGFMVVTGFVVTVAMTFVPTTTAQAFPFPPFLFGIFYLIIGAVYFFPILFLFRFSTSIRSALSLNNQNQLLKAFYNLRKHYRFIGILMIVFLALYAVIIAVAFAAGIFAGFSGFPGLNA